MSRVRELSFGLTAALLLLGGCFVDAPADDSTDLGEGLRAELAGSAIGGGDAPELFHGTYRVPVPDDLAPFAVYPLDDAALVLASGALSVSFTLPEGLVGYPAAATATFQGAAPDGATEITVTGYHGKGTCRLDGAIECALSYDAGALLSDPVAVAAYWRARGDANVAARVQVAELFDDDPLGVLRLTVVE